jgi:8-oxo-dGTP pyrophosphatase MutT (NUDIX family)
VIRPRAAAVVLDGGRVLLVKRYRRGRDYAVLPGGGIEAGETPEVAALRELAEETTLTARIDRLLWTGRHDERPAWYFLMRDVRGSAALSGPEAVANSPENRFELVWAGVAEFDALGVHPPYLRGRLGLLLGEHGEGTPVSGS